MKIELDIIKITLITGIGSDKALFYVSLPDGCWPYEENKASFTMNIAKGNGKQYLKTHFPNIPVETIQG